MTTTVEGVERTEQRTRHLAGGAALKIGRTLVEPAPFKRESDVNDLDERPAAKISHCGGPSDPGARAMTRPVDSF
jgi:hypothetical protein